VLICFSNTTAAFHIPKDPRVHLILGQDMTVAEAKEYLIAMNGPLDATIVDVILKTLGTRVLELHSMQGTLQSNMKDRNEVERYLQTQADLAISNLDFSIGVNPKLLDLLLALDQNVSLSRLQVMEIMGVTDLNTIKSMIKETELISFRPVDKKLTFDGTFAKKIFEEWQKRKEEGELKKKKEKEELKKKKEEEEAQLVRPLLVIVAVGSHSGPFVSLRAFNNERSDRIFHERERERGREI
jgi:hypothetical protein